MRTQQLNRVWRDGLSLMEVLFAIGVLMVGILGIASVLPIALRNASSALRTDETASAVENQFSNAVARLGGVPAVVIAYNPSQQVAGTTSPPSDEMEEAVLGRQLGGLWEDMVVTPPATILDSLIFTASASDELLVKRIPVSDLPKAFPDYDPVEPSTRGVIAAPSAPIAFCIDPAFLTATSNLRDDIDTNPGSRNLNFYDRTKFPCYDINYDPLIAPGSQMELSNSRHMTPRMVRVAPATSSGAALAPTASVANILLAERDGLPITRLKDRTLPPSLNFRTLENNSQVDVQRTGRFSSVVMFMPEGTSYRVYVVVYESRELGLFNESSLQLEFNLAPHANTVWPLKRNTNYIPSTYPDEVMGLVTDAPGIIRDGAGRFTFAQSNTCNPDVKVGQWLMLARYVPGENINRFGWYQIKSVLQIPRDPISGDRNLSSTDVLVTEVEVAGGDWVFHPSMLNPSHRAMIDGSGNVRSFPEYSEFDETTIPAVPVEEIIQDKQAVTIVVKAPRVVSVRSFML